MALTAAYGNLRLADERAQHGLRAVELASTLNDDLLLGRSAAMASLAFAESALTRT